MRRRFLQVQQNFVKRATGTGTGVSIASTNRYVSALQIHQRLHSYTCCILVVGVHDDMGASFSVPDSMQADDALSHMASVGFVML